MLLTLCHDLYTMHKNNGYFAILKVIDLWLTPKVKGQSDEIMTSYRLNMKIIKLQQNNAKTRHNYLIFSDLPCKIVIFRPLTFNDL